MQATQTSVMPAMISVKNSLGAGELAPDMQCRFDLPRYQMGCEKLLNMVPIPSGGITKRPGMTSLFTTGSATTGRGGCNRLLPFRYSASLSFMLLITAAANANAQVYILHEGRAQLACTLPFTGTQANAASFCQCGKVIYGACANVRPFKLVYNGSTFQYKTLDFSNTVPIPKILRHDWYGNADGDKTWVRYKVTAVNKDGREGFASEFYECLTRPMGDAFAIQIHIEPIPDAMEYRVYKQKGSEYGYAGTIPKDDSQFTDKGYAPDMTDLPPKEPILKFENGNDYPSLCFLHQQRLGFAASNNNPLTLWFSQSSNFECFDARSNPNDDDAIEVTLASTEANKILWAMPDRSGLAIGTEGEEWYLTGSDGAAAITPDSLSFQRQTSYGSQPGLSPLRANASMLFVQRGGKAVRDLGYSFQADRYTAQDLTLMARQIFRFGHIVSWAWQGTPMNILWCVLDTGKFVGLTYMPEHEIIAWHRHETAGEVLACQTLDDADGNSRLYFVVNREGKHYIERLEPFFNGLPSDWDVDAEDAIPFHLDGINQATFKARCIPCIPEHGLEFGNTALRVKKINGIKARVINSRPFAARVYSQNASATKAMPVPYISPNINDPCYSYADIADWPCPLGAGWREGAKLELILDGRNPVTILGLAITIEISPTCSGQV